MKVQWLLGYVTTVYHGANSELEVYYSGDTTQSELRCFIYRFIKSYISAKPLIELVSIVSCIRLLKVPQFGETTWLYKTVF